MLRIAGVALIATLGLSAPALAHQIWIEQADGEPAVVRFGEFAENLRETSPGLLDKFVGPRATLLSGSRAKHATATKAPTGFTLPFRAERGDAIVAEEAAYPLSRFKQGDREVTNWYRPAARLATDGSPKEPKLELDVVPTADPGVFAVVFKGKPLPKAKVSVSVQSGWAKEERTDEKGQVSFDLPWTGSYVLEVSHTDRTPGERAGAAGPEKYDGVNYVTTLHVTRPGGLPALPAGPHAPPNK